jgi:hypothetical protein
MKTFKASQDLGKTMPSNLSKSITVSEHNKHFGALLTCDVWTNDGYLVTSVHENGATHQLRKGQDVLVTDLNPDVVLSYNSNKRSKQFGY